MEQYPTDHFHEVLETQPLLTIKHMIQPLKVLKFKKNTIEHYEKYRRLRKFKEVNFIGILIKFIRSKGITPF